MEEIVLKDTLNLHWQKTMKNNFGFKMMQKMGWKEDEGLGREGTGITNYVKISKRDNGLGLGMDEFQDDAVGSKAWSSTIASYNSVLEVLKATYKSSSSPQNEGEEKEATDSSDDEKAEKTKQSKKKLKKEKSKPSKKSKGDTNSSDEESNSHPSSMEQKSTTIIRSVGIK